MRRRRKRADQLNDILAMIERISRVDTTGVAPMSHPLDGVQRLRARRGDRNARPRAARWPMRRRSQDGLFLVPRVVE